MRIYYLSEWKRLRRTQSRPPLLFCLCFQLFFCLADIWSQFSGFLVEISEGVDWSVLKVGVNAASSKKSASGRSNSWVRRWGSKLWWWKKLNCTMGNDYHGWESKFDLSVKRLKRTLMKNSIRVEGWCPSRAHDFEEMGPQSWFRRHVFNVDVGSTTVQIILT